MFPHRLKTLCLASCLVLSSISQTESVLAETGALDGERIRATSGAITWLEKAPPSVELFALESDTELFVFGEKKDHALTRDLTVDLSQPGDYFPEGTPDSQRGWDKLNAGVISKGTRVDSYYFHFDNKTYNDNVSVRNYFGCKGQYQVTGSITFERPILGIAMRAGVGRRAHLLQSDKELGLASVDYDEHYFRHFPGVNIADGCGSDHFILSADRRTLTVTNFTDVHHDNYRVIVSAE